MHPELDGLDARLVEAARGIHVLRHLSWPAHLHGEFMQAWRSGRRSLPRVTYPKVDLSPKRLELEGIAARCRRIDGPIAAFLGQTAQSYADVCLLIEAAGGHAAGDASIRIYGRPDSTLAGSERSNLEAARYFLEVSREYSAAHGAEAEASLSAESVADDLRTQISALITQDEIAVVIDPALASKAAAGATRIRLRGGTRFSVDDVQQLLHHEAFVHSLTALNGRRQPMIRSLSLGSPRTTATQEGLATFAELVTGAIDIKRMERIALRVVAIDHVLGGADFISLFEFFLEAGQSELESFNSAMRIFRGMPIEGGSAFTKDVVYLRGLLEVHTFFRWAMSHQRLKMCRLLFAGRMTLADVFALHPEFEAGHVIAPTYLPQWMTRTHGLTAYLAFSVFANHLPIANVTPDSFANS